jgi:putative transposase
MYVWFPLSLRQIENLLHVRGIDISHKTVRVWWNRFGPMLAVEVRKRRIQAPSFSLWRGHFPLTTPRMTKRLFRNSHSDKNDPHLSGASSQ